PERAAARRSLRPLRVDTAYGFPQLQPDTDPASVAPALAPTRKPMRLQFDVPLPERLVDAAAEALREHRHVGLYAYGRADPSLEWLPRFGHVRVLSLGLYGVTSFDAIASCRDLERLSLGQTASRKPSLGFLRELPKLERLFV